MLKVGITKKSRSSRTTSYLDVIFDRHGWADSSRFLPADYDLICMLTEDGQMMPGWCVGKEWEGCRYKKEKHSVIAWRKRDIEYDVAVQSPYSPPHACRFFGDPESLNTDI